MNERNEDLPFHISSEAEGAKEEFPPLDVEEAGRSDVDDEESLEDCLYETIDVMVHTLMRMQECLLRVAVPQMRFCPPRYLQNLEACLGEYDFISDVKEEAPGYQAYVAKHCNGKDPLEDVSFKLDKERLKEGSSWLTDYEAYDFSWEKGTCEEIFEKLWAIYCDPQSNDYDDYEELLFLAQRSFKYMTCDRNAMLYLNKRFIREREKKDRVLLAMKDELLLLYHCLRESGVAIPREGHHMNLNAFADRDDPEYGQYEDGYELDEAYFDRSGVDWD